MNTEREQLLDEIVTAYLKAAEAGQAPSREELLARHPDLAEDLAAFLSAQSQVNRLASPLIGTDVDAPTVGLASSNGVAAGTRVGYFGDYNLLEEIGRGGMGVVYKARQESLNRTVALKMILAGQFANESDVKRFHAEAESAAKLDHPGIVPVYEVGQHESQHYFAMAYVEGESLAHRLAQGLLAPREAAELTRKVAEAVAYAHVEGVIHRDLKPANILIDKNGQPRLTDFGLAKSVRGEPGASATGELTATGQILGTPSYMPPEQVSGARGVVGPLADVYSLGAVIYCQLTGRPPFQADNPLDTLLQVLHREPVQPRLLNPAVPRDLETICLKCLEKEPRKRYSSAQELGADLQRFLSNEPIQARPVGTIERSWRWCRRNPAVACLAASLFIVMVSGTAVSSMMAVRANSEAEASAALTVKANDLADEKGAIAGQLQLEVARVAAQERLTKRHLYFAHMNLANDAWKNGNVLRVLELLDQHRSAEDQEDLRSFEWGYLWQQCNRQRKTFAVTSPGENVGAVAISSDGKWIAVGVIGTSMSSRGEDCTFHEVRFWDVSSGTLGHTIKPKINAEDKLADERFMEQVFSPDGKLYAAIVVDHLMIWHGEKNNRWGERVESAPRIRIWDVETMKVRATIPLPNFKLLDRLAISPDSKRIAAGHRQSISVWSIPESDTVPAGAPIFSRPLAPDEQGDGFRPFTFSADSKSLLWSSAKRSLTVTNVSGEGKDVEMPVPNWGLRVSPDGKYFANFKWFLDAPGGRTLLKLLDAKTGKELHTIPASTRFDNMAPTRFSPDSRILAVTNGLSVDLWDVESKQQVGEIRGNNDYIRAVAFGENGKTVITVANNKSTGLSEAKVWDAATRPGPDVYELASNAPSMIHPISRAEKVLKPAGAIVSPHGILATIWDWGFGDPSGARALLLHNLVAGSPGKQLAHLKWRDRDNAAVPTQFKPAQACVSPDGTRLALSGHGNHFVDGRFINDGGYVQLWQLSNGKATFERAFFAPQKDSYFAPSIAFSPDGTKLVYMAGRDDSTPDRSHVQSDALHVFDIASGKSLQMPADPEKDWSDSGSCIGIVLSSDGKRIFTTRNRQMIVSWDPATGQKLASLQSPIFEYVSQPLALSADDRTLASCHGDHSIILRNATESNLRDGTFEKPRVTLRGHAAEITAMAFHPDGKTFASSSRDGTIKIWDVVTGELRMTLEGHAATTLAFTKEGTLISGDASTVKTWRAAR